MPSPKLYLNEHLSPRRLLRLLNTLSAEELKNQIRWLNEFK